jgi:hypothetical protein
MKLSAISRQLSAKPSWARGGVGAWEHGSAGAWEHLVLVLVLLLETQHGFPTAPPAAKPRLVPAALVILFAKG